MASSLTDALFAEEPDHKGLDPVEYEGERKHTAFERERLAMNPCQPIYQDVFVEIAASLAEYKWLQGCRSRSRSVPVTCSRGARALFEGSL